MRFLQLPQLLQLRFCWLLYRSYAEVLVLLHRYSDSQGRAALMFNLFDTNGDGELTLEEVRQLPPPLPFRPVLSVRARSCAWLRFQALCAHHGRTALVSAELLHLVLR